MRVFAFTLFCLFSFALSPLALSPLAWAADENTALYKTEDAFIRATPGKVTAGYVIIENPTKNDDVLVGASASWAGRVELHEVQAGKDGVMEMKRVDEMPLKAGARLALRPGGKHLMVFEVQEELKPGKKRDITLNFRHAGSVNIPFAVKPIGYKGK